jgi:hypothetical protein
LKVSCLQYNKSNPAIERKLKRGFFGYKTPFGSPFASSGSGKVVSLTMRSLGSKLPI